MTNTSRYTSLKLLISYLLLLGLMAFAVWYLFQQQYKLNQLLKSDSMDENQLAYTELIRDLYETDNQSKVALQTKSKQNINLFLNKNTKIIQKLDSLKSGLLQSDVEIIDTLKQLLNYKKENVLQLLQLQKKSNNSSPITQVVSKIENLEEVKGKLKIENLFINTEDFNPYQKRVAQDFVDYLNENVPKDSSNTISAKEADSILTASKIILLESQKKNNQQSIAIKNKEVELLRNELFIAQKLTDIISKLRETIAKEQEQARVSRVENQRDSLQLVTVAAIICLLLVIFFFILLSTDFLKNKTYRQELELQKQKTEVLLESREQLMAAVSHDIRTPLQSIIGYGSQLLEKEESFQNRNKLIKIKSATHYIEQLVLDLLDYVRMEKGKIKVFSQEFELNELLEETAQSIADLHQEKEVILQYVIQETEDVLYYGDYNKIRQILYNLIGNAFKFTAKGSVTIATRIQEDRLFIAIKDTGVGIASESFEKIFDSFTQENAEIELLYGGTGLGLSICKKLAHLLDGKITLESKLGEGSIFTISLPLNFSKEVKLENEIELDTCLVLDDDSSQIELTKSLLLPYFNSIVTFTSGNKALEFCKKQLPSIVFSDIQMPEMSGYDFVAKLRKLPNTKHLPVVFISGQIPNDEKNLPKQYNDFLLKPYTTNQLLTLLSKISGKKIEKQKAVKGDSYGAVLKRFIGDNPKEIQKFIQQYKAELTHDIVHLEKAIANKNSKEIAIISHKMQTMIGQLEEKELYTALQRIELQSKKRDLSSDYTFLFQKLNDFKEKLIINDIV
ncbi:response regulator [Flavobacterium jejuense]|uniref:histidine kinase n=1 Tax=Flavobacterium jejuense TaxID=1544455 RepID=A0ABX0IQI2_9FLAO|nr:ATP-binding protein [Flavobacterium jejuense]NHN25456.1 response regulator [Flavobacterium jejuense]